ncbi:MAG: DEAD/DEAH box helicase [Candidatus Aenigmarchaeota archaeon]|nr:DEAD/DEAH box helicase [Candidatus Aenigmarchaeota archaeon]
MTNVFNILDNRIKELAVSRFKVPTQIQEMTIPKVLEGSNVLVLAGTGSGKTESVMLGLFNNLVKKEHEPIALLYLTPMKALNRDLMDRLVWWCSKLDLDISVRHGDTTQHQRKLQTEYPPHIMISTPEQIGAMLTGKNLREILKNIKYIVIDEVHELVTSKRGVQLALSLERLKRYCGNPQIIALSATVGSPELAAKFIFSNNKHEIVKAVTEKDIELKVESPQPTKQDKLIAEKIFIGDFVVARLRKIYDLITEHKSALTFTNTREAAEILSSRLRLLDENFPHEIHHSSLSKDMRIKAESGFKDEKLKALIATSSLELGIDIGSIDLVLQYMSPRQVSKITQRIGRSGHGVGRLSKGFIITSNGDDIFESTIIARRALAGELEKLKIHEMSLDVLTQQIMGLLIECYKMPAKEIYETFVKAYPFKDLTKKEFNKLLNFLVQLKLIYVDDEVKRSRKAFDYYYQNLSVIPDQKNYKIIDTASNTFVGTLDEEFIASHSSIGSSFIVRGRPWRIVSVEEDRVFVEADSDIESSVPAWEGELIPVQFEITQEVGKLRGSISRMLGKKLEKKEIIEEIKKDYPVSSQTADMMIKLIKEQMKKHPVPDGKSIVFESYQNYLVLHTLFGSMVNETLSRLLTSILSAERGEVMTSRVDPYRIILRNASFDEVKNVLMKYRPDDMEVILQKTLPKSSLFKFRFIHVAKRFGAISRKATFGMINLERLIDAYWNSPIYDETFNEIFTEKLDIEKAKELLGKIQEGAIKMELVEGLSPIAKLGFRYELQDAVKPDRPEKEIFKLFRNRLMNTKVRLLCINCGEYSLAERVEDIPKEPKCNKCRSKLIAVTKHHRLENQKIVKKWLSNKPLNEEEKTRLDTIKKSADLCIVYGKLACIVLAGRGVGPSTAFRILSKRRDSEEEILKNILEAERQFIKNKRFWQ